MQKRAQFYLVAALIIVGIIASLATIYNTAKTTKEDTSTFYLAEEINFEGSKILDSGTIHDPSKIQPNLIELMDYYNKTNPQTDLLFIYGKETDLTFYFFNNTGLGTMGAEVDSIAVDINSILPVLRPEDNLITINTGTQSTIDLKPGKFFFVVLKKEKNGERFVALPQ